MFLMWMKCRAFLFCIAILLTVVIVGCYSESNQVNAPLNNSPTAIDAETTPTASRSLTELSDEIVIVDDLGREVILPQFPQKIASLSAAHTEILFAIGAGNQVVAVDLFSNFPLEAQNKKQLDSFAPNLESISGVDSDLIIVFFDPGNLVSSLESLGLKVIFLEMPSSISTVFDQIELLGYATGHVEESALLIDDMEERIDGVRDLLLENEKGVRVFHELDPMLFTVGPGSFVDDLYNILGAENIAASAGQAFPQLSNEVVIESDPEVIILADESMGESTDTVSSRDGWSDIAAVLNERVHVVDKDIMSRPGPRLVEALEILYELLYP